MGKYSGILPDVVHHVNFAWSRNSLQINGVSEFAATMNFVMTDANMWSSGWMTAVLCLTTDFGFPFLVLQGEVVT